MHENLIERLRNFEGSDALGNGDFSLLHEAADALEAAREDAERYRWLRAMAKEQLLNPKAAGAEYSPDMRTYWSIPTLICSGPVGGHIDFDAAIDQARGKGGKEVGS